MRRDEIVEEEWLRWVVLYSTRAPYLAKADGSETGAASPERRHEHAFNIAFPSASFTTQVSLRLLQ